MFENRIDLCDGITASFSSENNVYICFVPWLSRKIEIWLSAGDYDDPGEIDSLKCSFEKFWNDRTNYLTLCQNDIKDRLLPYIYEKKKSGKRPYYPDVSADDFDADYWLTSVYILSSFDGDLGEIQMNFYKEGNEENSESFFVSRDFDGVNVSFYVDMDMVTDNI